MCLWAMTAAAQTPYRITAGISIKEKKASGEASLVVGTVYFDTHTDKLVYDITFPAPEVWVFHDSSMYKITKDSTSRLPSNALLIEMSIFNLALNGSLDVFGLDTTQLKPVSTTLTEDNLVVSSWKPKNKQLRNIVSKVELAKRDKLLMGVSMYAANEQLMMKQIIRKYEMNISIPFPQDILQITYSPEAKEDYRVTTFRNIRYDEAGNDAMYDYPLPNTR